MLLAEIEKEPVPDRLLDLARRLQKALAEKSTAETGAAHDDRQTGP